MKIPELEQRLDEKAKVGEIKSYTPVIKDYFLYEIYKILDKTIKSANRFCSKNDAYLKWLDLISSMGIMNPIAKPQFQNPDTSKTSAIREYEVARPGLELYLELLRKFPPETTR